MTRLQAPPKSLTIQIPKQHHSNSSDKTQTRKPEINYSAEFCLDKAINEIIKKDITYFQSDNRKKLPHLINSLTSRKDSNDLSEKTRIRARIKFLESLQKELFKKKNLQIETIGWGNDCTYKIEKLPNISECDTILLKDTINNEFTVIKLSSSIFMQHNKTFNSAQLLTEIDSTKNWRSYKDQKEIQVTSILTKHENVYNKKYKFNNKEFSSIHGLLNYLENESFSKSLEEKLDAPTNLTKFLTALKSKRDKEEIKNSEAETKNILDNIIKELNPKEADSTHNLLERNKFDHYKKTCDRLKANYSQPTGYQLTSKKTDKDYHIHTHPYEGADGVPYIEKLVKECTIKEYTINECTKNTSIFNDDDSTKDDASTEKSYTKKLKSLEQEIYDIEGKEDTLVVRRKQLTPKHERIPWESLFDYREVRKNIIFTLMNASENYALIKPWNDEENKKNSPAYIEPELAKKLLEQLHITFKKDQSLIKKKGNGFNEGTESWYDFDHYKLDWIKEAIKKNEDENKDKNNELLTETLTKLLILTKTTSDTLSMLGICCPTCTDNKKEDAASLAPILLEAEESKKENIKDIITETKIEKIENPLTLKDATSKEEFEEKFRESLVEQLRSTLRFFKKEEEAKKIEKIIKNIETIQNKTQNYKTYAFQIAMRLELSLKLLTTLNLHFKDKEKQKNITENFVTNLIEPLKNLLIKALKKEKEEAAARTIQKIARRVAARKNITKKLTSAEAEEEAKKSSYHSLYHFNNLIAKANFMINKDSEESKILTEEIDEKFLKKKVWTSNRKPAIPVTTNDDLLDTLINQTTLITIHIIGGFLGAGKTTLLTKITNGGQYNGNIIYNLDNDGIGTMDSDTKKGKEKSDTINLFIDNAHESEFKTEIEKIIGKNKLTKVTNSGDISQDETSGSITGCICCTQAEEFETIINNISNRIIGKTATKILTEPTGSAPPGEVLASSLIPFGNLIWAAPDVIINSADKVWEEIPKFQKKRNDFRQEIENILRLNKTILQPNPEEKHPAIETIEKFKDKDFLVEELPEIIENYRDGLKDIEKPKYQSDINRLGRFKIYLEQLEHAGTIHINKMNTKTETETETETGTETRTETRTETGTETEDNIKNLKEKLGQLASTVKKKVTEVNGLSEEDKDKLKLTEKLADQDIEGREIEDETELDIMGISKFCIDTSHLNSETITKLINFLHNNSSATSQRIVDRAKGHITIDGEIQTMHINSGLLTRTKEGHKLEKRYQNNPVKKLTLTTEQIATLT